MSWRNAGETLSLTLPVPLGVKGLRSCLLWLSCLLWHWCGQTSSVLQKLSLLQACPAEALPGASQATNASGNRQRPIHHAESSAQGPGTHPGEGCPWETLQVGLGGLCSWRPKLHNQGKMDETVNRGLAADGVLGIEPEPAIGKANISCTLAL